MSKQLKQIFSLFVAVVMIFSMFAGINLSVSAEDDILDYIEYEINNGKVTITDCDDSISGDIVIPDTIEGYPVTSIGAEVFRGCGSLISVVIPDSVTEIGNCAFEYCYKLKTVVYPDSMTYISDTCFFGCHFLENITIPESVRIIGVEAFQNCYSLKNIEIPKSVKEIYAQAFHLCFSLESVIIPEGVTTIEGVSIGKCINLKNVIIPNSVTRIAKYAFYECYSLEKIYIPESVNEIETDAFRDCMSLKDIYIYNPDIILDEESIGYTELELNGELDEITEFTKEYYLFSSGLYCSEEEYEAKIDVITEQYFKYVGRKSEKEKIEGFTIHGYEGSTSEAYANEHGFKFVPICDHASTETINFVEADCKNNGYTGDVYCNDCEEIISYGETIPVADHNYTENIIKEPTYTQPGLKNDVCENCGDTTAEEEIPQLTIENSQEKENTDTDISIIYPDGTFDGEIKVEVSEIAEGDAFKLISHKEGNYKVTMFDINVTVDGEKVQPDGTVLVKIPLPKGYNQNKCAVYYVADDGTMEELKTYHYKDGYVYFETDHFSYYAIIEEVAETTEEKSFFTMIKEFFEKIAEFFAKIFETLKNLFA